MRELDLAFRGGLNRSLAAARKRIDSAGPYAQIGDEDRARALHLFSYAFSVPEAWPETAHLLLAMMPKMEMAGHRNDWIPYLERGLQRGREQNDLAICAELNLAIGYLELVQGNFQAAEAWFEAAQDSFQQIGSNAGCGKAYVRLARLKLDQELYEESAAFTVSALTLLNESDVERANCYYVIGSLHLIKGELDEGEQNYRISLGIWEEAEDQRRIAWGLGNLGILFYRRQDYKLALSHLLQALDIFQYVYDPANEAQIKNSLAMTYWQIQSFDISIQLLAQAQRMFTQVRDEMGIARVAHNLGMNYSRNAQWDLAYQAYQKSLIIWEKLGLIYELCNSLDSLGELYLVTKKFDLAISTLELGVDTLATISDHPSSEHLKESLLVNLKNARNGVEACH